MTNAALPILYSFRRCPYAMRARMSLCASAQVCELREVVLRNKPVEMLTASAKGTVPVLIDVDGTVFDESLDIVLWALGGNDPHNMLKPDHGTIDDMMEVIGVMDGPFKTHLDRYKYPNRYQDDDSRDGLDATAHRDASMKILQDFERRLSHHSFLFGSRMTLCDIATAPFVRQFAHVDKVWFDAEPFPNLQQWLAEFLKSDLFLSVMHKYDPWDSGNPGVRFPV